MTDRRNFLHNAAGLSLAALGLPALANDAAARKRRPLIIDALGGIDNTNLPFTRRDAEDFGIDARSMADAKASGLTAFNMTIGYVFGAGDPYEKSLADIRDWNAYIEKHADALLLVRKGADILRARDDGRIGVILGFQNAAMMGDDARRVETFAKAGIRVIQLTYNGPNQLGDGSMAASNQGLTPFGRDVVAELNRNRVLVDLSYSPGWVTVGCAYSDIL